MELIYLFLFCVASINLVNCDNACSNLNTCGECIGYPHLQCVWCAKEDMKGFRCLAEQQANKTEDWCPRDQLYNPEKFSVNVITNKDFQSIQNGNAIQFKPQEIFIKVRPGIPAPFTMSYKPAEDFPLDVYILMDMSYSMQTVKQDLQNQIFDIFTKLGQLSNNSVLGIGSFVEKPVFPYYDKNTGEISYSFKNYLSLTKDKENFTRVFKNIKFGANFDDLEAGFDALMQVITCNDIGWRPNSRRIIIYLTESAYHSVGDGKMIGIIKPNDMQCHLKDGVHETGTVFDYPSVSQLNLKALENKMKIIFVTKSDVRDAYEALENYILDSKYEELKKDSKTVEIIDRAFKELTASVGLDTRDWPSFVTLTLDQDCTPNSERNCRITPETPTVTIPAELKVNMCPEQKKHKLFISPRSASDILTINLEINCECNCEKNNNIISSKCSNAGYYQCGICKCVQGRYGETCSCTGTSTTEEHLKKCQANSTSVCSGNGICICGLCKCHDTFSGQFCQYDNTGCPNFCSGHGDCEMGICQCHDPWAKDDCSCDTTDHSACIDPYSHKVCAGHGTCLCGKCTCDKIKEGKDEKYSGSFCEGCPDCVEKRCKELGDYVYCYYMDQTNNECDLLLNKVSKTIRMVNITEFQSPTHEWRDAKICERLLDSGDSIVFKFRTDLTTRKLHILVQNEPKPPNRANFYIAVASAIAAVLLIGLLTLIAWKILIDLHDKREYNKFAKQAQAEGYDVSSNPLYEQPTTDFHNPAYSGNQ